MHLGEKAFAAAWAEGRMLTPEQVLLAQDPATTRQQVSTGVVSVSHIKVPSYPAGLTAREVEVLRLVALGLSDAQVARRLVISPRTVNTHLTSIYNKLGVDSRTAASRFAVERQLV
jgi:DNA-binding NarL/FixJ family response regulator